MAEVRRRTVLGAALAALGGAAGCASVGAGNGVRVAVSWSATELAAFRSVLAGWGGDYELVPFGDDIDAALGARTTGRPHVVALPRLGLVDSNVGNLELLPPGAWDPLTWGWNLPGGGDRALPFKLAHKSVVWFRRKVFAEHGLARPTTWDQWLALNDEIIERGLAPLSLGGADGWMLTGFFENILLRNFRDTYDALAEPGRDAGRWQSAEVRATFEMFGDICGRPGALAGGMNHALVQQFPDAVLEVFRYHRAAMVVVPDFAESVIRHFGVPPDEVDTFTFPARTEEAAPLVMAGDLFVLTRPASQPALDLIRYLGTPAAPEPWIRHTGGFIAANPDSGKTFYSPTLARLSGELRTNQVRFDLADRLGAVGGRDGLQLVLVKFLRGLGDGTSRDEAVRTAVRAMGDIEAEMGVSDGR
jgi:alpha-glucoside transport system substrate-binding protein